jgi:hypothetical protein
LAHWRGYRVTDQAIIAKRDDIVRNCWFGETIEQRRLSIANHRAVLPIFFRAYQGGLTLRAAEAN